MEIQIFYWTGLVRVPIPSMINIKTLMKWFDDVQKEGKEILNKKEN